MSKLLYSLLFCILTLITSSVTLAQYTPFSCGTPSNPLPQPKTGDCDGEALYAPDPDYPEHRPMETIYVNIHFIQKTDSSGNFTATDDGFGNTSKTGYDFARKLIEKANAELLDNRERLEENCFSCDTIDNGLPETGWDCHPGNDISTPCFGVGNMPTLPDQMRFQYEIYENPNVPGDLGIYFHTAVDSIYNEKSPGILKTMFSVNDPNGEAKVIDVFLQASDVDDKWNGIATFGVNNSGSTILDNIWNRYDGSETFEEFWKLSRVGFLNHEIGHILGLRHTFDGDLCSDTPDNNQCNCLTSAFGDDCDEVCDAYGNMMAYNSQQTVLSPCQLCTIHYAFYNAPRKFLKRTYCTDPEPPLVVEADENLTPDGVIRWKSSRNLHGDLIIKPKTTLVLTSTLEMPENAKIVVERGAKLIVDGGKITNACEPDSTNGIVGMWQGIQVWGHSGIPHTGITPDLLIEETDITPNGLYSYPQTEGDHGVVVLLNEATIENAYNAITTQRQGGGYFPDYHGGIIYANDVHFINNKRSVEFMQFNHPDNASAFVDCDFTVNNDFHFKSNYQHVTIWDVSWREAEIDANGNKIPKYTFEECFFDTKVTVTNSSTWTHTYRPLWGIFSIDGKFSVKNSKFKNLEVGIATLGTPNEFSRLIVEGNGIPSADDEFSQLRHFGILSDGYYKISISDNDLFGLTKIPNPNDVPGFPNHQMITHGIYIAGSDIYDIYDNRYQDNYIHTAVYRTGNQPSSIWGNTFRVGEQGVTAIANNSGLKISCNDFVTPYYNISVVKETTTFGSINHIQGGSPHPQGLVSPTIAGNLFTNLSLCDWGYFSPDTHVSNFEEEDNEYFEYYYGDPLVEPRWEPRCITDSTTSSIDSQYDNLSNIFVQDPLLDFQDCTEQNSANIPNNTNGIPEGFFVNCEDENCLQEIDTYLDIEKQPLVEGDAQSLKDEIANAPLSSSTKTALLDKSPYLSDAVLIGLVEQTSMLENDAKDILLANAPLTPSLWTSINNRVPAYSNATLNAIQTASTGRSHSDRQILENWLHTVDYKRQESFYHLLDEHIVVEDWQRAIAMLQGESSLEAQKLLVSMYLQVADYTNANAVLAQISSHNTENTYYKDLQNLYITLQQSNRTYFDMTTIEEDLVRQIALSKTKISSKARGILALINQEFFPYYIPTLPNQSSKRSSSAYPLFEEKPSLITIQPNPAKDYVRISVNQNSQVENRIISLYDFTGKPIAEYRLNEINQIYIPTYDFQEGIYFVTLMVEGQVLEKSKLILIH